jgi:hypothetical protein
MRAKKFNRKPIELFQIYAMQNKKQAIKPLLYFKFLPQKS